MAGTHRKTSPWVATWQIDGNGRWVATIVIESPPTAGKPKVVVTANNVRIRVSAWQPPVLRGQEKARSPHMRCWSVSSWCACQAVWGIAVHPRVAERYAGVIQSDHPPLSTVLLAAMSIAARAASFCRNVELDPGVVRGWPRGLSVG